MWKGLYGWCEILVGMLDGELFVLDWYVDDIEDYEVVEFYFYFDCVGGDEGDVYVGYDCLFDCFVWGYFVFKLFEFVGDVGEENF